MLQWGGTIAMTQILDLYQVFYNFWMLSFDPHHPQHHSYSSGHGVRLSRSWHMWQCCGGDQVGGPGWAHFFLPAKSFTIYPAMTTSVRFPYLPKVPTSSLPPACSGERWADTQRPNCHFSLHQYHRWGEGTPFLNEQVWWNAWYLDAARCKINLGTSLRRRNWQKVYD